MREHCVKSHANRDRVTINLCQRYWDIHLRLTVRAVEKKYRSRRGRRVTPWTSATENMTQARLNHFDRPFANYGLGYLEPIIFKFRRRRRRKKRHKQRGAWKEIVGPMKTALNATLHEKAPLEEVLRTLLTEIEFCINARSPTDVSVDPRDPEALTPNHFLLGSSIGLTTRGTCKEEDRKTCRVSPAPTDHLWRRWLKEYLSELVHRGEPNNNVRQQEVSAVVIVVNNALPRNVWPVSIIERTHQGIDGGIRIIEVRTKTGIFRRPVSKLFAVWKIEEAARASPGRDCYGRNACTIG